MNTKKAIQQIEINLLDDLIKAMNKNEIKKPNWIYTASEIKNRLENPKDIILLDE